MTTTEGRCTQIVRCHTCGGAGSMNTRVSGEVFNAEWCEVCDGEGEWLCWRLLDEAGRCPQHEEATA